MPSSPITVVTKNVLTATEDMRSSENFNREYLPAAAAFACLYLLLLLMLFGLLLSSIRMPHQVCIPLFIFCCARLAAYVLRSVETASDGAGQNTTLVLMVNILFDSGFAFLLDAAYEAVTLREMDKQNLPTEIERKIVDGVSFNRGVARIALVGLFVMSVVGQCEEQLDHKRRSVGLARQLQQCSLYLGLGLSIVLGFQALLLCISMTANTLTGDNNQDREPVPEHTASAWPFFLLFVMAVFLFIRQVFYVATLHHRGALRNEALWYPLAAMPEFISAAFLCIPKLSYSSDNENGPQESA
ncbi:hypothetical protein PUNSTDRAFT_127395 [Punctularia strigosozonata HHB-11173 SS5]|uniref:uncharacterized protein n=1 Tax=Punctularia strigosozonata (strain HHB-11173) TaxID=741275 RepID=UPI00044165B0|nr:uncharacterized protein PUNSTDRAFT_127395 [Punctularia strigosozonata HHB-11173 SS5]EIN06769.1 hypothetical protein PUNSTDRAFT_127395 [Punctularia strigosozonata HHB-11173 SS5]